MYTRSSSRARPRKLKRCVDKTTCLRLSQRNLLTLNGFKWRRSPFQWREANEWHAYLISEGYNRENSSTYLEVYANGTIEDLEESIRGFLPTE